jgi:hypothetical protein
MNEGVTGPAQVSRGLFAVKHHSYKALDSVSAGVASFQKEKK